MKGLGESFSIREGEVDMAIGDTGVPQIRFATTLPYTVEQGGNVTFNLELTDTSTAPITVFFRSLEGSADGAGFDFDNEVDQVTFAAGTDTASFTVFVREDTETEPDEFYFVELFNPVGATFGGRNHSLRGTAWILDDDAGGGQPRLAVTAPVVLEGAGVAVFTVSLSEEAAADTEVSFSTVSDSAIAGRDFVALADSVTIEEGETSATVEIALRNDREREAAESFGLRVETPDYGAGFARAALLDDDGPLPTLSIERVERVERSGYVDVTLRLSEAPTSDVTVGWRTVDGTAEGAQEDHDSNAGSVTFEGGAAGDHTASVRVYVRDNSDGEPDESWFLELFNPVGASFGGRNHSLRTAGWILDNDAAGGQQAIDVAAPVVVEGKGEAVFTVSLSEAFAETTQVRFATVSGSARAGSDFVKDKGKLTFHAGQTEATVAIDLKNDGKAEAGETFGLKVSGPRNLDLDGFGMASLLDDDGLPAISIEGTERIEVNGYQTVILRLSEASANEVTVDLHSVAGSARDGGVDFDTRAETVTFGERERTATAQVYVRSDTVSESDEFFYLALSNPEGARFGPGDLAPRAIVWIRDDDPGTEKRALAVSDIRVSEGAGNANFTISLSRPLEDDLVIRYKTQNGSAKAKDFVGEKGKITVDAGATEAVVSVKLKNDRRDEDNETFKLKLTAFDRDDFASSGHDTLATATIVDDDARGRLAWDADALL